MKTSKQLSCHLVSLLIFVIVEVNAETKTYKVEDTCVTDGMSFSVNEDDEYELTYSGNNNLALNDCVYKFSPSDTESKLCIKTESYDVNTCGFSVMYEGARIDKRYDCYGKTIDDYCDLDGGKTITIRFLNGVTDTNPGDDIKLRIAYDPGFDYTVMIAVLSGLGGVGIISFVIFMICYRCKCCENKQRGDSVSPSPPSASTSTSQTQRRPRPTVQTQSTSTHEMSTQITPPPPSEEPTYLEDGIHKPRRLPPISHTSHQPIPEPSAPPLVPNAPAYDNEPPPTYEQAMGKTMDV